MNFSCDRQELLDALTLVSRAVPSRSVTPILECVLLTAEEGIGLTLCANDKDLYIDTKPIQAQVELPGAVALDAKLFIEIVRKLGGAQVTIEVDERNNALCKSGRARLKISGLSADEFPVLDEKEMAVPEIAYKIKEPVLKEMIRQTIFSVGTDINKMVLTGELFDVKNDMLQIVALDMYRISYRAESIGENIEPAKAVIPGKALNELSRILSSNEDDDVTFFFNDRRAIFSTKNFRLASSLLMGDFIRYDQIFNEDFATMVVIERELLLSSFERAALIAVENRTMDVKIDITDDFFTITSRTERGNVEDGVPCETEGSDLTIHFNPRYFIEPLRAITDEMIVLKFNTWLSPCTIKSTGEDSAYKYLIVPLKIRE